MIIIKQKDVQFYIRYVDKTNKFHIKYNIYAKIRKRLIYETKIKKNVKNLYNFFSF